MKKIIFKFIILMILSFGHSVKGQTTEQPGEEGYFASCSDDKKIILWNKIVDNYVLGEHEQPVKNIELLSQNILISGSSDGVVKVWNLTSFNLSYFFNLNNEITKILKLNESNFLISLANSSLFHFMLNEEKPLASCNTQNLNRISGLKLINEEIVSASLDGNLSLWDMSLNLQKSFQLNSSIHSLEIKIENSDKKIYCGSENGLIMVFDLNMDSINEIIYADKDNGTILSIFYSKPILVISTNSSKIIFNDINKQTTVRTVDGIILSIEQIKPSHIATGLNNGSILIWNSNSKIMENYSLNKHGFAVNSIKSISKENALYFPFSNQASIQSFSSPPSNINIDELTVEEFANLLSTEADLTDCLGNCSNQGTCKNNGLKFFCSCSANYGGSTCQINLKPCSSNPCLNNGLCIDDLEKSNYKCNCTDLYEGKNCQIKLDVCKNETCSSNGYCVDDNNYPKCECFYQFSGEKCEIESNAKKVQKFVVTTSSIIAIIFIFLFFILLLIIDLSELFCRKEARKKSTKSQVKSKLVLKPKMNNI